MKWIEDFEVEGLPLSDLALDGTQIVMPDGSKIPFKGFVVLPGKSIEESIAASLPEGAYLERKP